MSNIVTTKTLIAAASLIAVGIAVAAQSVGAADNLEKCYGVAAAGKNDCATATSSCAGSSKVDRQKSAFVALPKGLCGKLAGGSLSPK